MNSVYYYRPICHRYIAVTTGRVNKISNNLNIFGKMPLFAPESYSLSFLHHGLLLFS